MRRLAIALSTMALVVSRTALAADPSDAELKIDLESDLAKKDPTAPTPAEELEAPPPPPYKKSLVVDGSLGALAFFGKFGEVAPPAPWFRTAVGYEIFRWLMPYAFGELGFSDTSGTQAPPKTRAFPMFGFGGGARFTARFVDDRLGVFAEGEIGLLKADVGTNTLGSIGYKAAESLGLDFGGRLGVEWYQVDRHLALGLHVGTRLAEGFQKSIGSDTPLVSDAAISLRYAF